MVSGIDGGGGLECGRRIHMCVGGQPMVALNEQFHHNGTTALRRRLQGTGYGLQRDGETGVNFIDQRSRITDQKRRTSNDLFIDHYSLVIERSAGADEIICCGYPDNNRVLTGIGTGLNDPETELCYSRNRTYSPVLGRWLQRDPIGYAGGVNLYEYVGGIAAAAVDPDGTIAIPVPKSGLEAVVEAILAAILAAYLLHLARQAAKIKCTPRERETGCSSDDCYSGRPCGAIGSGRSCQWRIRIAEPFKGQPQCGCYAGGPGDEN